MKKQTKIKSSSLPMRSPVGIAMLFWLFLEHIKAPEWAYGVYWTFVALLVFAYIASFFIERHADVDGFGDRS